jgi:hypothetical protein
VAVLARRSRLLDISKHLYKMDSANLAVRAEASRAFPVQERPILHKMHNAMHNALTENSTS